MSALLLPALLRANLALAAAILLVMALRRPARRRFGALAAYLLWLTPPLCALATLLPAHGAPVLAPAIVLVRSAARQVAPPALAHATPMLGEGLAALWLLGVLAMAAMVAIRQARFVRSLGELSPMDGEPGLLRGQHTGAGPMVLGFLFPRIVAPADFDARFEGEVRRLVLDHERVHLTRGDAVVNALAVALQCLAWFNPLVHLGAHRMRLDQEMACDEAVMSRHPQARRVYAETLLNTLLVPRTVPFGCHWPASGAHPLKERLVMLNTTSKTAARRLVGLGLACAVGLAGAGAVWAANPEPAAGFITKPVWTDKPDGADLAHYSPPAAVRDNVSGGATIDCDITAEGRLTGCVIVKEDPAEYGFGAAVLQLSQIFQMAPVSHDGVRTAGGKVRVPMRFMLGRYTPGAPGQAPGAPTIMPPQS